MFLPRDAEAAVRARVPALRRHRHAGGRADHRCRPDRRRRGRTLGWYDVSTLKEPYRIEGKKTMGFELAEQLDWRLPDWILYPTGGGTGLIGMWKAFDELERIGWIGAGRAADGVGAGRRLRADRPGVRAGTGQRAAVEDAADRSPMDCAYLARLAIS